MKAISLRQKEILTGLFGIFFFFGGFLVGEIGLRVVNELRFGGTDKLADVERADPQDPAHPAGNGFFKDGASLRRPYPNQRLGRVRINNHGFRGPDIAKKKPSGVLRLAFLGSSTTYDAAVPEGKDWPAQAIGILNENAFNCEIDFINAGLPGFSTPNMEAYWRTVIKEFEPDIVIVLPGDMTPNIQRAAKDEGFQGQVARKDWLTEHSALWALITKNVEVVRLQRSAFSDNGKYKPDEDKLVHQFSADLGRLIDTVGRDSVFLAVPTIASHVRRDMPREQQLIAADSALYYLPYLSIPTLIDMQDAYNAAIRSVVGKRRDVLLIDGDELIPADNRHFVDSRHFAPLGSAIMGNRISSALLSSPLFRTIAKERSGCDWPPAGKD